MSDPSRRTRSRRFASDETVTDVLPITPLRLTPAVKAGADGNFLSMFDASTSVTLVSKEFDLFNVRFQFYSSQNK